jgi:hypothetical protein
MFQQLLLPVSRSSYAEICESDHCHSSQSFCHHRRIKDTHRVLQYDQAALKGSRMDPESLAPDATESSIGKTTSIPWFDNMVSCILTSVNSSIRCPELYETSSDKLSCFKENESGHKRSRRGLSYDDRTTQKNSPGRRSFSTSIMAGRKSFEQLRGASIVCIGTVVHSELRTVQDRSSRITGVSQYK